MKTNNFIHIKFDYLSLKKCCVDIYVWSILYALFKHFAKIIH